MAVLVKFLTVVTRIGTIKRKYPGGLDAYIQENLVADDYRDRYIVGVLFMSSEEAGEFMEKLVSFGFKYDEIALVDQFAGKMFPCPWLDTSISGYFSLKAKDSTCWLKRNKQRKQETHHVKGERHD